MVTTNEPTLTHHNHLKSTVTISFTHGVVQPMGLTNVKWHVTFIALSHWVVCTALNPPPLPVLCLHIFLSTQPPLIFTLSSFLSFLEHHIIGIIQSIAVSDWLLSFSNGHYLLPGIRKVLQALHAGTVAGERAHPDSGASLATLEKSLAFPRPWFFSSVK